MRAVAGAVVAAAVWVLSAGPGYAGTLEGNWVGTFSGVFTTIGASTPEPGLTPGLGDIQSPDAFNALETAGCDENEGPTNGTINMTFTPSGGDGGQFQMQGRIQDASGADDLNGQAVLEGASVNIGFNAINSEGEVATGNMIGTLSEGTLALQLQASDESCVFVGEATLTGGGSGGGTINPADSSGTTVTNPGALLANIGSVNRARNTRVANWRRGGKAGASDFGNGFMLDSGTGLAAGDGWEVPFGLWLSYSYSDFDDSYALTAYEATRSMVLGGVDFSPWDSVLLGLSVGWEQNDIDTAFNRGKVDTTGITVSPYFAALFGDIYSIDLSFGYTGLSTDQHRTLPGTTTRVDSSVDADRWFWSANLNAGQQFGALYLSGRAGLLWAREYQDAYVESNGNAVGEQMVTLGQWRIGIDAAYMIGDFEPYATASYEHDYSRTEINVAGAANDRNGALLGLGLRWFGMDGFTASFDWTTMQGREDYGEHTFYFLLRGDF